MEIENIKKIDFNDGKKRVLILGNGLSRNYYEEIYDIWNAEIWGCNWVYKEYLDKKIPRLDLLIGDYICLKKVIPYAKKELKNTRIIGKSNRSLEIGIVYPPSAEKQFFGDSGSTATVHAINEGYDEIYLLGFDLGGPDIYQQNHHLRNKKSWLRNWRNINERYGLEKVFFIGFDHKSIIRSPYPDDIYAMKYMRGEDHLDGKYEEVLKKDYQVTKNDLKKTVKKSLLIIGNGNSRLREPVKKFIKNWKYEVWGCNYIYKEKDKIRKIKRIGIDNENILKDAIEFKENNNDISFDIIYPYTNENTLMFYEYRGYLVEMQLIIQAIYEGYNYICLAGIDFADKDVYNNKNTEWKRGLKEFKSIIREFGLSKLRFVGGKPNFLIG